ncbi:MAG: TIGR04283 family arsenosugar biosynthesis glycosyltransferase [Geobacteraceae bacterium]|nr:TIGR04283 family arsenosugar biosynthesis glycosyltransferase [Geobacteraceae bacterium]
MNTNTPDISLIVPLLNEAAELPGLFANLDAQEGVNFEVIFCDGGSCDGSLHVCQELGANAAFAVRNISTSRGRGLQMNAGAGTARSGLLLFLHADSRFMRADALRIAVSTFSGTLQGLSGPVAARFRLRFRRKDDQPSLAYYFYESKSRLDRADCIRGDQGFLLQRSLFTELGGFDTSLPFLEDVFLAEKLSESGRWLLLPAEISTSARRFEREGLYERQVVNAIITNAVAARWTEFFSALPGLYRCDGLSGRLQIFPVLDGIRTLLAAQPTSWRQSFWRSTGRHVAGNIWQLFFWLDVRSSFNCADRPDTVSTLKLQWFRRNLERFTRGRMAEAVTAAAVWTWFRFMLVRHGRATETS